MRKEFLYLVWYFLLSIPIIILYIHFSARAKREWLTLVGKAKPQVIPDEQKREYIRLESAFPVEFQKIEEPAEPEAIGGPKKPEFDIYQGFTRDISKSGMCIEALSMRSKKLEDLIPNETKLRLIINIPSEANATIALATVRWVTKSESMTVDRYSVGVSFEEIPGPDLENIIRYALWFKSKPDILSLTVVIILLLIAALFSTAIIFKNTRSALEERVEKVERERTKLTEEAVAARDKKEELQRKLDAVLKENSVLLGRLKSAESRRVVVRREKPDERAAEVKEEKIQVSEEAEEIPEEEIAVPTEPIEEAEEPEEEIEEETVTAEPVVALRVPALPDDEIVVEPNITRKMIESEEGVYKTFRDYILKEDIQLLDRYASTHRTSIYHVASLFALAELRYKNMSIKEMTRKAYRDVIRIYPRSKYASYASHRLEQLERNLPYGSRDLRYFMSHYNLPPLSDYRELEPYKK